MEHVAGIASCQVCAVVTNIGVRLCLYVFTHSIKKAARSRVAVLLLLSFSCKTLPLVKMHSTALYDYLSLFTGFDWESFL
jgi:hypothetical protein